MKKDKYLQKVFKHASLFVFIMALAIPLSVFAQSSDRDYREWRRWSSSLRNKVNNLDDDAVEDVPIPILFGIAQKNLSPNFGDPRSGGRVHEGLDIMAPLGAPIVSPTEAVVLRTGTGASSGKYVYTANPGGETFAYMHLDEIADIDEGDELDKGELIGYVGNTGNASGGATHLHFEIQDDDGDATDPYPRLTEVFELKDKIEYLEDIINGHDDEEDFAEFIVKTYKTEILMAKTLEIDLSEEIEDALGTTTVTPSSGGSVSASGNLTLGSRGTAVVTLQKFLIKKGVGSASRVVADGSFGPITQKALAEYQASVGIKPAAGYYGAITRAYIEAHP